MSDLFKQKLLNLRQPKRPETFADALYAGLDLPRSTSEAAEPVTQEFTEKEQVLESLERFAQEKLEATPEKILKIPGGEIGVKAVPAWEHVAVPDNFDTLLAGLTLDPNIRDLSLKKKQPGQVRVIFVTEKFRPWSEVQPELGDGFLNEILPAFSLKTSEFFARMVQAMKLETQEVLVYPSEGEHGEISEEVVKVAAYFRPEIVVTLGASASHRILKVHDRLSLIHGQFLTRSVGQQELTVVPLFHPSIIETNLNMKKAAWADMQKIMKHLKKLP